MFEAGSHAPTELVGVAVKKLALSINEYVAQVKDGTESDTEMEELVRRVIKAHVLLARTQGAATAIALTGAEVTTVLGSAGTLTPSAAVTGLVVDLVGLAWIQVRMVLIIGALYGHDPADPARHNELLTLMGVYGPPRAEAGAKALSRGTQRVARRLILRHLKGTNLQTLKGLFNLVGVKFQRTGLIKTLPGINIPVSYLVNGQATVALGNRARSYYATLPSSRG